MSWESAAETASQYGGGLFVKFSDGDARVGAFLGEPEARETVWLDGKTFDYDKDDPTHAAVKPSAKFRFNFFMPGEGIKILEVNQTTFGSIVALKKKYNDFKTNLYEITRIGTGTKTVYQILPERACTDVELEAIKGSELNDLQPRPQGTDGNAAAAVPKSAQGTVAVMDANKYDAEFVSDLMGRLKALDRSKINDFLAEFRVSKIKDLQPDAFAAADAFVGNLEAERDGGGVDPFAD